MAEAPSDPSNILLGPGYSGSSMVPPGPPSDGGLEALRAKVDAIQSKVEELNRSADRIDDRLRGAETLLSRVDGNLDLLTKQIVGRLPSWWQLLIAIPALASFVVALLLILQRTHVLPP